MSQEKLLELVTYPPLSGPVESHVAPIGLTVFSSLGTLAILMYSIIWQKSGSSGLESAKRPTSRSTILPGYGILGDKVNEIIAAFLDALAIYVHNDSQWDCSRRMLCAANQRASEYGITYGILTYFLSLTISFLLRDQRVSESLEAMRRGRHNIDCRSSYPHCPFSL